MHMIFTMTKFHSYLFKYLSIMSIIKDLLKKIRGLVFIVETGPHRMLARFTRLQMNQTRCYKSWNNRGIIFSYFW